MSVAEDWTTLYLSSRPDHKAFFFKNIKPHSHLSQLRLHVCTHPKASSPDCSRTKKKKQFFSQTQNRKERMMTKKASESKDQDPFF